MSFIGTPLIKYDVYRSSKPRTYTFSSSQPPPFSTKTFGKVDRAFGNPRPPNLKSMSALVISLKGIASVLSTRSASTSTPPNATDADSNVKFADALEPETLTVALEDL